MHTLRGKLETSQRRSWWPRGPLTADAVIVFVHQCVARYTRVRVVRFVDRIPTSPSGKILRRVLAARERTRPAPSRSLPLRLYAIGREGVTADFAVVCARLRIARYASLAVTADAARDHALGGVLNFPGPQRVPARGCTSAGFDLQSAQVGHASTDTRADRSLQPSSSTGMAGVGARPGSFAGGVPCRLAMCAIPPEPA